MATSEFEKRNYPGLNQQAADLWRQWLKLYETSFESYDYNVRVGRGLDPGPSATDAMRAMWKAVTTKRIDVVAHRANQTWVIEIEPRPGMRTLGQIVAYYSLLPQYFPVREVLIKAVIAQYLGYDMIGLLRGNQIMYFQFKPGYPASLPPTFLPSSKQIQPITIQS